ncbi:MAG: hypothetical protein JWM27_4874 [Gemmatimonadetes bacterium]|nr:hypothetical protein [Gemmatimonadota bacterium]
MIAKRQWCIPEALRTTPGTALEAEDLLNEAQGAAGLLYWMTVRDVHVWAGTGPGERPGLFREGAAEHRLRLISWAGLPARAQTALNTIAAILRIPELASPGEIATACLDLAEWTATNVGRLTALAFAQSAAVADPDDPDAALQTGIHALEEGQLVRAGTWFRRAIALSRRSGKWDSYSAAYIQLATGLLRQGRHDAVRRAAMKAMRAARRHGTPHRRTQALHVLMLSAREQGDAVMAERFAHAAWRAARREKPASVPLLMDLARWWTDTNPARARTVLRELLAREAQPGDWALMMALMARAAAHKGDRAAFDEAWAGTQRLLRRLAKSEVPDEVAVHLSHSAALFALAPRHGPEPRPRKDEGDR